MLDGAAMILKSGGATVGSIFLSGRPPITAQDEMAILGIGHLIFLKLRDADLRYSSVVRN
jgi:hypothetical protein